MAVTVVQPGDTTSLPALAANSPFGIPTTPAPTSGGLTGASGETTPAANTTYTTEAAAQAAANAANAAYAKQFQPNDSQFSSSELANDITTGNYAAAWKYADSFGDATPGMMVGSASQSGSGGLTGAASGDYDITNNAVSAAANPAIADLESASALQQLDPNAVWNATNDAAFYAAAEPYWNSNVLGGNPYGSWGGASSLSKDASTNAASGNAAPNLERYGGAVPSASGAGINGLLQKYGETAAQIGADIYTAGAAAPITSLMQGAEVGAATGLGNTLAQSTQTLNLSPKTAAISTGLGALGGALGYESTPLTTSLTNVGVNPTLAAGAVKGAIGAGTGALGGALTGTGALSGAVKGGVTSGIGSVVGSLANAAGAGAFSSGIGSIAGQIAGNTLTGAMAPNGSTGMYPTSTATSTAMPVGSSLTNFFSNSSNIAGLAGIGSAVAGGVSNSNIASMQNNAYTTAGNAANYGNAWGATGAGGVGANFSNGQYNSTAGAFSPMTAGYANTGASSIGAAGQYAGGATPSNVTGGYNTYMNTLNNGIGTANAGVSSGQGMMNTGTNTLNSANANYTSAYNTSLNAGLAALNPAIQQQSNALLNSNFERGQAGTSGGALNTQALQNSFNTADEQVQQNAVTQGLAAMNTTGSLGLGEYNAGASATGNFNTQASNLGQQAMTGNQSYSSYAPTLAGQYINNANATGQGATTVNNMGILTGQAAQGAVTNQGTQMNNAAKTQGAIANTYNGGLSSYLSSMLGGVSGNLLSGTASGATGGISSLLSSILGGGSNSSSNPFSLAGNNSTASAISSSDLNSLYSGSFSPDMSNIGETIPSYTSDMF